MNREPMTETMHEIAVYGAGGLGREICCLLRRINAATDRPRRFVGFFDDGLPSGSSNDYGPVLGGLERLNAWERPLEVVVAVGSPEARRRIVEGIRTRGSPSRTSCRPTRSSSTAAASASGAAMSSVPDAW